MLSISKLSGVCETLAKRPLLVNYVKDFAKLSISTSSQDFSAGAVTKSKKLDDAKKEKQMSSAMRMYLKRKREHDIFISKERAEFDLGKQHLANMMGLDPDNISHEQIDQSIENLFPSGSRSQTSYETSRGNFPQTRRC